MRRFIYNTGPVFPHEGSGGGSGPTPNLEQVTTAGNVTDQPVIIKNVFVVTDPGQTKGLNINGATKQVVFFENSGTDQFVQLVTSLLGSGLHSVSWRPISGVPALLSDIPAPPATPNLEQVTTAGATTDQEIRVTDGTHGFINLNPWDGNSIVVGANGISDGIEFGSSQTGPLSPGPFFIMYAASGSRVLAFKSLDLPTTPTGTNILNFRNRTATVAYLSDLPHGTFAAATFTGTTITIPHGQPFTPAFATITAKNAATAGALVGGYFLSYNATNIVVTLLVSVAVAIAISIDWSALA